MSESIAASSVPSRRSDAAPPVLALLALWLLATIGLRPLLVPDEGRYAGVAREMLLSGDWLVPRLDGLPFFHKPPLLYWLDAAAMQVFGVNQFAARLAPALGAFAMGAALFLVLRRWHGVRVALTALGVLATAPLYFIGGQYANHDMLVAGCISVAVLGFAAASASGSRREWQIGWAACAFALLAKGLIGLVLPLAVVGPWLLARRRWGALAQGLHPWSWLPALLIAAPWFVAMQLRFPQFFDYFVLEQQLRRYTQSGFNNTQPFWFFFAVLPLLTLPWSLAAPRALRHALRSRGPWLALYGWWTLVVLLFFSLPNSKLVGYALPALAPWCALIACSLEPLGRRWRVGLTAAALLCLAAVAALALRSPHSGKPAGHALAAHHMTGDPVVFVDGMFYDLPFYAGLGEPVLAASDWSDPAIARSDTWRRELADAARFDLPAAQRLLYPIERLAALACRPGVNVWFVSAAGYRGAALAGVPGLETVYADGALKLQRAAGRDCAR